MDKERRIRLLCTALVAAVLVLSLILVVAVCGSIAAEGAPEETTRRNFWDLLGGEPFSPEIYPETIDFGDFGDFGGEWQGGLEWPTLEPEPDDPEIEWTTIPGEWETLPAEWETLPEDWEVEEEREIGEQEVRMDGSLASPSGALGAGVASQLTVMNVYSEINDRLYLKMQSFGDYTGQGFAEAEAYGPTYRGWSADILPSTIMMDSGHTWQYWAEIEPVMKLSAFPYYLSDVEDGDRQTSDVLAGGRNDVTRRFYYQKLPVYIKNFEANDFEFGYRSFVYDQYTRIDDISYQYLKQIIDLEGFDPSDPYIIQRVATYIQNAATYNMDYNTNLDRESNIAMAFLGGYKEGVCRHFAAAATLLYRALGIPARYTVGFAADVVAGIRNPVNGADAHAWVEVYVDGFGWQCVEVTGSLGEEKIGEWEVVLKPTYQEKRYDGTPLTHTGELEGFEEYLNWGYTYEVKISHESILIGVSPTAIDTLTIYDPSGMDVTGRFKIKTETSSIRVFYDELMFVSQKQSKSYDGIPLTAASDVNHGDGLGVQLVQGSLPEGYDWKVIPVGEQINVGTSRATFRVQILAPIDGGYEDVTDHFLILRSYGTLEITPGSLTLTADSVTRSSSELGGSPLTAPGYQITDGKLALGDYIAECIVEGEQARVGRSDNVIKRVVIRNAAGEDVTGNYIIDTEVGQLKVTP